MLPEVFGCRELKTYWTTKNGKEIDILENGKLSCAFLVSSLLLGFRGLLKERHAGVRGLLRDMQECGWHEIAPFERWPGSVVLWEVVRGNSHVGIGVSAMSALSNCRERRVPVLHPWDTETDSRTPRAIEKIYWHDVLNE